MIFIVLLYFICALTFPLAKATLSYSQPFFYVGVRMTCAGLVLLSVYRFFIGPLPRVKRHDFSLFLHVALFAIYIAYLLDLWSLQYITSIESAFIFNLSPFISAFFSYFWFGETMNRNKWIGLGIAFFAIIPLLFNNAEHAIIFHYEQLLPVAALIFAVIASVYGWIAIRELVKNRSYEPLIVNGYTMLFGGIAALLTSYIFESWSPSPVINWPKFIFYTGAIIIICNGIFYNLYAYLLMHYTATLLAFSGFLCPLFAALLGAFFLHEPLTVKFLFSFFCIVIGLYIFYREELRQGYVQ